MGAPPRPLLTLSPGYAHTVGSFGKGTGQWGCGVPHVGPPHWNASSGWITGSTSARSTTCLRSLGPVGGLSSTWAEMFIAVAIPFHVPSSGSHSIATALSVLVSSTESLSNARCPLKSFYLSPPSGTYETSGCTWGADRVFGVNATLVDVTHPFWAGGNSSAGRVYNWSEVDQSNSAYNFSGPGWVNVSTTYRCCPFFEYNAPGLSSFTWNAPANWTMWTNGTAMTKSDRYALVLTVWVLAGAWASNDNLRGPWTGHTSARVDLISNGTGLAVRSLAIT